MPLVNVRVDDATRALWVEAAGGEMLTLSEWIRKACDARLGLADRYVDKPLRLNVEEATEPVGETDAAAALAKAARPEREWRGPDLKPGTPRKKR